jgi:hypothetical protein
MQTASADFTRLYSHGGLHAPVPEADELARAGNLGQWIGDVYAPYTYDRPMPQRVWSEDPLTEAAVLERYRQWNARYRQGAPTDAFAFERVVLYDRSLYGIDRGLIQLYETNRPVDRPWKSELDPALLGQCLRPRRQGADFWYVGSVGSENYAHWLIDDLTRIKAIVDGPRPRPVELFIDSYFPEIDNVRLESLSLLIGDRAGIDVTLIDKKQPHFFDRLHYVTPSSYHPFLKCPDGIRFLRDRLAVEPPANAPKRLFVGRRAWWRNLLNQGVVEDVLSEMSFTTLTVDLDSASFAEQVALFSRAETIVGVSGASLVHTIFAPPSARICCLAGEGFVDPFFWDLAAVTGHAYAVCFGRPRKPKSPDLSSFTIAESQIQAIRAWL